MTMPSEEEIEVLIRRARFFAADEFFKCPTDGRPIAGTGDVGDDKVLCNCPSARKDGGTHYKFRLENASARDYVLDYLRRKNG
jgi:hypothetical protein